MYRVWQDTKLPVLQPAAKPVLIAGAGRPRTCWSEFSRADSLWRAVGLLDDDPALKGRQLHGVPVVGACTS